MKSTIMHNPNLKKSTVILLLAIVAVIFANAPRVLAQTPTPSPRSDVQVINVPKSVIQNEDAAAFVQTLLLRVEVADKTAAANQQTAEDNAKSRDEWKTLYLEQQKRADKLEAANLERQTESKGNAIAVATLRDQLKDANDDRESLKRDLDRARSNNKFYGAIGFAGGVGVCSAIRK